MTVLSTNDTVQLLLAGSGHTLRLGRLHNGGYVLDGRGGLGRRYTESNWTVRVHSKSASIISLTNDGFNLGVANGKLVLKKYATDIRPGQESQFFIRPTDLAANVILEPLAFPGCYIGADKTGRVLNVFQNHEDASVIQVHVENPVSSGSDIFPLIPDGFDEVSPLGVGSTPTPASPASPAHPGAPSNSSIDRSPTSAEAVEATRVRLQQLISPTSPAPGGPKQINRMSADITEPSKRVSAASPESSKRVSVFEFTPRSTQSPSRDSNSSHDDGYSTSETKEDERCGYMKYYLNAPLRSQQTKKSAVMSPPHQHSTSVSSPGVSALSPPRSPFRSNSPISPGSPSSASPTNNNGGGGYVAPWRKPRSKPPSTGVSDF